MVQETVSIIRKINHLLLKKGNKGEAKCKEPAINLVANDTDDLGKPYQSDQGKTLEANHHTLRVWSRSAVPDDYQSVDGEALLETIGERIMRKFHRIDYAFSIDTLRRYCWTYTDKDFQKALELLASRGVIKIEGQRARLLTARERIRVA